MISDSRGANSPDHASPPGAGSVTRLDWSRLLARAVVDDSAMTLAFQPIADLVRGTVAGYETLARFDPSALAPPDVWFRQADAAGVADVLEARVVTGALRHRESLPAGSFLTINLSPHLLGSAPVKRALKDGGDLTGVVLELTEHVEFGTSPELAEALAWVRGRGAMIAMDDAGSGYAGITQLVSVRPEFVKLDRALVDHCDVEPARLAAAEMLGALAGRLDAWLITEGLERAEELEAVIGLGAPLGQGWLLGRPGPLWSAVPAEASELIRERAARSAGGDTVGSILVATAPITASGRPPSSGTGVRVDGDGLPLALLLPLRRDGDPDAVRTVTSFLRVLSSTSVWDLAERVTSRAEPERFDPVVVCDEAGRYVGLVTVDALLRHTGRRFRALQDLAIRGPAQ